MNKAKELVIKEECFLLSVVISTFPVLYFFTLLNYTGMASTASVLLTHYCALSGQHYRSAVSGLVATLCRQTNIVLVGLSVAVVALVELFSYTEMGLHH